MDVIRTPLMMVLVAVLLSAGTNAAQPTPSVEKIMADYYRAMGGLENLRAWKGMKVAGRYVMTAAGGTEIPFTVWYKAPDKQRIEMTIQGQTAVYVSDGKNPWFWDPTRGATEPTLLPEDQARDARNHSDEYPFIEYEKKGHRLELLGQEVFEGRDVFKVKLTRNNGSESFHYFDRETGLEIRIMILVLRGGQEGFQESVERDFRRVGWLTLPFHIDMLVDGRLVRKMILDPASLELDPDLDDSFFGFPQGKKAPAHESAKYPGRS